MGMEAQMTQKSIWCIADKRKQMEKSRRKMVRVTRITQRKKVLGEGLLEEAEAGKQ